MGHQLGEEGETRLPKNKHCFFIWLLYFSGDTSMNCRWLWRDSHMSSQVGMMSYEPVKSSQVRLTKYLPVMNGQVGLR